MKYFKLSVFLLAAFMVLSSCGGGNEEEEERRAEEEKTEEEEKIEERRQKDMDLLYRYAGFYARDLILENCGSENQPECEEVCANTDFLKNEEMKDACYIECDFDPYSLSISVGAALGRGLGRAFGTALTSGLAPYLCKRPE